MNAIFGETRYSTTGFPDRNIVEYQASEVIYCAGCNGSVLLDFTGTSIGSANGVYGVGFYVIANTVPYVAFVTYGDNTTENVTLPVKNVQTPPPPANFWGITSGKLIRTIHVGGDGGVADTSGPFAIASLTIGSTIPIDADGDGVHDSVDNCTNVANGTLIPDAGGHSQLDSDGDGYGNRCDADLNNSGVITAIDFNLFRSVLNQPATASALAAAADLNGSGLVNAIDFNILRGALNQSPGPSGLAP